MGNRKRNYFRTLTLLLSAFCFAFVFGFLNVYASSSTIDEFTVTVPESCSLTSTVGTTHSITIENGVYFDDVGETTINVFCNDAEGFSIYAVGYTNDTFGNNTMKPNTIDSANAIASGIATSGDTSNWAMKLTSISENFALTNDFGTYHIVPDNYVKVATYSSNTTTTAGVNVKSTYAAYISQTQPADTYVGKVKYIVVHPANELPRTESISQLTYMQDLKNLTPEERWSVISSMAYNTTYNLIDNRDNKTYQVARLKDNNIWMAQNLDFGRTALTQDLTSSNTNLEAGTTIVADDFNSWAKTSISETFTSPELVSLSTSNTSNGLDTDIVSGTPYGTLYNYCAASAGTICAEESANTKDATSDICPAGWALPTGGWYKQFYTLYNISDYNSVIKMRTSIENGGAAFALAGYAGKSGIMSQGYTGSAWSSSRGDSSNGSYMKYLSIESSRVCSESCSMKRTMGHAMRCVVKRPVSTTISYDTGVSSVQVNGITVQNGDTIELEADLSYPIIMTLNPGYYSYWSVTSGRVQSPNALKTNYIAGNVDATLTVVSSYESTEMQNISQNSCTTTASHARDTRDDHVYTIQRLADGNCWMMENLDLGRTELTTDLTPANTNLSSSITSSTFNSWIKTSGTASYTSAELIPITASNSYDRRDFDFTSGIPYGTLYNYCAASAGTICADNKMNDEDASYDICPAGWRLPTGGDSGEFKALSALPNYNDSIKLRASIDNGGAAFALAGNFYNSLDSQGRFSGYWSSTRSSGSYMYSFSTSSDSSSSVWPTSTSTRYYGHSIRCLLKT